MLEFINLNNQCIKLESARSSGPGGQHVQKTETKVRIKYYFSLDSNLNEQQKNLIENWVTNNLNKNYLLDEKIIFFEDQTTRSRTANIEKALKKLKNVINKCLEPKKTRHVTKPSRASIQERLSNKKSHAQKKLLRSKKILND
jgi:ribosome-associated protein